MGNVLFLVENKYVKSTTLLQSLLEKFLDVIGCKTQLESKENSVVFTSYIFSSPNRILLKLQKRKKE